MFALTCLDSFPSVRDRYIFCALKWCSFLAEKVIKYLTGNAYILVAITGKAFIPSGYLGVSLLLSEPSRCLTVQGISWAVMWLGKICITAGSGSSLYYIFTTDSNYMPGGEFEISDWRLPVACAALMGTHTQSANL